MELLLAIFIFLGTGLTIAKIIDSIEKANAHRITKQKEESKKREEEQEKIINQRKLWEQQQANERRQKEEQQRAREEKERQEKQRIWEEQQRQEKQRENTESEKYYIILGATSIDTDVTIKKKYHEMLKRYHPDTILKEDTPDDIVAMVNKRYLAIQEAYEKVCKLRKIE